MTPERLRFPLATVLVRGSVSSQPLLEAWWQELWVEESRNIPPIALESDGAPGAPAARGGSGCRADGTTPCWPGSASPAWLGCSWCRVLGHAGEREHCGGMGTKSQVPLGHQVARVPELRGRSRGVPACAARATQSHRLTGEESWEGLET